MLLSRGWLQHDARLLPRLLRDGKRQHLGLQTALMAGFQAWFLLDLFNQKLFGI